MDDGDFSSDHMTPSQLYHDGAPRLLATDA